MMISVDDAARIMAAVQLGQKLPVESLEASRMAEQFRKEIQQFPAGVMVSIPADWDVDDRRELVAESVRRTLHETLVRSDRYRFLESAVASIMPGGSDHWKGQPRDKNGKWVDSGVAYNKWPSGNSAAMSAKKKIKLLEQMVANGDYAAFAAAAPVINSKQPNSYQKGILKAYANLHEIAKKAQQAPPKNAVEVPGTPALAGWSKIGGSLGTEKGGTYIGPDGKKYYVKTPDNAKRAHNEVLAFKLYELAGGNVVHSQLVQVEGKISIATEWEEAEKLKWSAGDKAAAAEDFALHAWLNNWDAVGAGSENPMDNIKLIKGNTTLVDAGGSLDYSGMGGSGKKAFTYEANEWDTLRNPKINKTMAQVFGGMTDHQLYQSAMKLQTVSYNDITELVHKYHPGSNDDKNVMVDILAARKGAILQKAHALLQKNPSILDSIPAPDEGDDIPTIIMASPGTGTPEVIPPAPAAVVSKTKTKVLPPPPFVQSVANPTAQSKLNALYEAASTGGAAALAAVKTNPDSKNTYAKKAHAYKLQLMKSLVEGGAFNPDHVVAPSESTAAAAASMAHVAAVDAMKSAGSGKNPPAEAFSAPPSFVGSKAEVNSKIASEAIGYARAGDAQSLSNLASQVPAGTKIHSYIEKLKSEAESIPVTKEMYKVGKAKAEQAEKEFAKQFGSIENLAKSINSVDPASVKKIGWWNVLHEKAVVPHAAGKWDVLGSYYDGKEGDKLWAEGNKLYKKLTQDEKDAVYEYTGGAYKAQNLAAVGSTDFKVSKEKKQESDLTKNAVKKISVPLPVGSILSRKYTPKGTHDLKVGMVISQPTVLSTSSDENVWSGSHHMKITIGKGVKAAPVAEFSKSGHSESEFIMQADQKFVVTKITESYGKTIVHVLALPTD